MNLLHASDRLHGWGGPGTARPGIATGRNFLVKQTGSWARQGIPVRVRKSGYTLVITDEMTHPAKQNGLEIIEI